MSMSSMLVVCVVLLALAVSPASADFRFQAYNDSSCSQPLSTRRFPVIELPSADCLGGYDPGADQCILEPTTNISAITYRITPDMVYINVFTLPTLLNETYCPTPYLATQRTVQITADSGPVEAGGNCWAMTYLYFDHTSGKPRRSSIYADLTCGRAASNQHSAAAEQRSAHLPLVLASAAALSLVML
jgi:hypothetical protein